MPSFLCLGCVAGHHEDHVEIQSIETMMIDIGRVRRFSKDVRCLCKRCERSHRFPLLKGRS
jgi:hypothetical protein